MSSLDMADHVTIAGLVFIIHILQRFIRFWWKMIRCYALTRIGFVYDHRRYGDWVVVTGATDGIGKEYARQFAKEGMKIVLISRTRGKLESVAKEIESEFNVETKCICFDFKQLAGSYELVEKELNGIDIGILVNNVATAVKKRVQFAEKDIHLLLDTVHCNVISELRMTHMIMKGMIERGRGLVVHVSSSTLYFNLKYCITYPATKAFVASFWKALRLENRGVIDHQLVTPFVVSTNAAPKNIAHAPSAEEYVTSAIRTIGITDNTCGYWIHEVQKCIYQNVPECIATLLVQMQLYYLYKQSKLKKR